MIVSVRGQLVRWDPDASTVWVDVQGVSYEVLIPAFAAEWIGSLEPNSELHLYTYYYASERNPTPQLIGFRYQAERQFFRSRAELLKRYGESAEVVHAHPQQSVADWAARLRPGYLVRSQREPARGCDVRRARTSVRRSLTGSLSHAGSSQSVKQKSGSYL